MDNIEKYDCFVSHSSKDATNAMSLVERLESRGVKCWVAPRNIRAGAKYSAEIVTGIQSSASLIVLISKDSLASRHVEREVNIADGLNKSIYPVKLIDIEIYGGLSFYLSVSQEVRLFEEASDPVEKLISSIRGSAVSAGTDRRRTASAHFTRREEVDDAASLLHTPDKELKESRIMGAERDLHSVHSQQERETEGSVTTGPNIKLVLTASLSLAMLFGSLYFFVTEKVDEETPDEIVTRGQDTQSVGQATEPTADTQPGYLTSESNYGRSTSTNVCGVNPGNAPAMVVLPPGQFVMGSDAGDEQSGESQVTTVNIAHPFELSRCEISVVEFTAFVDDVGYVTSAEKGGGCWVLDAGTSSATKNPRANWRLPGFLQQGNHPAVCISWDDANKYIEWLNSKTDSSFRLPSESELEYAIRGGSGDAYPWGEASQCEYSNAADLSMSPELKRLYQSKEWTLADCNDGYGYTAPVASFTSNSFGLYDVSGNVWEWAQDCWSDSYNNLPGDGSASEAGDCHLRMLRGGSWLNDTEDLRSSVRFWDLRGSGNDSVGFRLARSQ